MVAFLCHKYCRSYADNDVGMGSPGQVGTVRPHRLQKGSVLFRDQVPEPHPIEPQYKDAKALRRLGSTDLFHKDDPDITPQHDPTAL